MVLSPGFFDQFKQRRIALLIDDSTRSFRSALVCPAEDLSESALNHVISLTGGLPFVAVSNERASAFMLASMSRPRMTQRDRTPAPDVLQYVSVEAREGISTGISAHDRAETIRLLGAPTPQPRKLVRPGHIFPVATKDGGVLVKLAIPEGALDLVREAGCSDAALFLDLLDSSGALAVESTARTLASREAIPVVTLSELIAHRLEGELLVKKVAEAKLPTRLAGELRSIVYRSTIHDVEHIALVKGTVDHGGTVLVRVQSEHTIADVFGGVPPSRQHLLSSLQAIGARGEGVLLYLRRHSISDTVQRIGTGASEPAAAMREYGVGAQILRDLGITRIELLSSAPRPLAGLSSFGIEVVAQTPIPDNAITGEQL